MHATYQHCFPNQFDSYLSVSKLYFFVYFAIMQNTSQDALIRGFQLSFSLRSISLGERGRLDFLLKCF